jgi:hypothetical protein
LATSGDDSGETAGTPIGADFGTWTQDGFTAPFGTLVGKIGSTYFEIGTSFVGPAPDTGTLFLMYWDSNSGDNTQFVTAHIDVPEPGILALLGLAFAGLGFARRRKLH